MRPIRGLATTLALVAVLSAAVGCASPRRLGAPGPARPPAAPPSAGSPFASPPTVASPSTVASLPPATSPSAATGSPAPDYAAWCGDPAAVAAGQPVERSIQVRTSDGVTLAAVEAGSGRRGVLLLPEVGSGGGLCGWLDFAGHLAGHGFRTLAIDHRCLQESGCGARTPNELVQDIEAAVARLRADGAATVSIVGASQGASEALIFGAAPPRSVAAVVDRVVCLSSDELTLALAAPPYPVNAPAAARRMTRPVMYVVSDGDPYVSVAATRSMYDSTPARLKRLVALPSTEGHGWRLVDDPMSSTTAQVVAFLGAD